MNKHNTVLNIRDRLYGGTIYFCFLGIILYLLFLSLVSTSMIDRKEHIYYLPDNIWSNLIYLTGAIVAGSLLSQVGFVRKLMDRVNGNDRLFCALRRGMLFAMLAAASIWVLSTQYIPGADQFSVQAIAASFADGDYQPTDYLNYLRAYPGQLGLVFFSTMLAKVFGNQNYIVFQLLNAGALTLFYREISELWRELGARNSVLLFAQALGFLFFPPILYCSFVYGNLLGLFLSVAAIRQEILFFRKGGLLRGAAAVLGILAAMIMKQNYMIFAIGMLIYGFRCLDWKRPAQSAVLLMIASTMFCSTAIPRTLTRIESGVEPSKGMSSLAWIAMGLQDGPRAPGWYNSFNWNSFFSNEQDKALQADAAKESIRESLEGFRKDEPGAVKFFTQKIASQWNEPTFQSFWIVQIRKPGVDRAKWAKDFASIVSYDRWAWRLNILELLLLFGAAAYCALCVGKDTDPAELLCAMIFAGGFLFHLFWEGKGQYTISYFVLLLPYSAMGFSALWGRLGHLAGTGTFGISQGTKKVLLAALLLGSILLAVYANGRLKCLTEGKAAYQEFLVNRILAEENQ